VVRINQLIALERGRQDRVTAQLARHELSLRNPARLLGQTRRYERVVDDSPELPTDTTTVQVRVTDELENLKGALVGLFDVTATKARANCDARVDVTLEGQDEPILMDVPVSYLLFLENQLAELRKLVRELPVLDPAERWTWDEASNAWVTAETVTLKPQKVLKSMITAPATDKFPAQVHVYSEDVPVGRWHTTKFSGALEATRVRELTDRIEKLLEAVKRAREEANSREVSWVESGGPLLDYILAP